MRAISSFSREAGMSTFWCRAWSALRTLVSISATGSVNLIVCFSSSRPFASRFAKNLRRLTLPLNSIQIHSARDARAFLPGRFRDPGNLPAQCQPAEAQAAQSKLAQVSARPSAQLAAVVPARGKLGRLLFLVARQLKLLLDLCVFNSFCCSHAFLKMNWRCKLKSEALLRPERHAQMLQQRACLVVICRRGHDGDVHALHLIDLLVGNLRKDQLVVQAERVIATAIE